MSGSPANAESAGGAGRAAGPPRRSLSATLTGLARGLGDAAGADAAAIYLVDPTEGDLVLRAAWGLPQAAIGHRVARGEGLSGKAAADARSVVSRDAPVDPRAQRQRPDWQGPPPVRGVLATPLRAGATVLGVVELTSTLPEAFDPDTRGRLSILGDAAALLVEQALLLEQPPQAALEGGGGERDPIGIATVNTRGVVTSASPTFCRLVAQPVEAIVGRPALTILPALGRPGPRDALEAAWHGAPGHVGRLTLPPRRRGQPGVASLSLIPVGDPARGVDGVMLALQDVSAHARLEAELRAQTDRAVEARDRLRAVIEVVSHELRTPLTSVLGFARLLEEQPEAESERRERWAEQVIDKARLMARLVDEVTELARLGAIGFSLEPERLQVAEVARTVAREVAAAASGQDATADADAFDQRAAHGEMGAGPAADAGAAGAAGEARTRGAEEKPAEGWPGAPGPTLGSITLDIAPNLPPLEADRDRLAQVLRNLLENALKYGPAGGPVLLRAYLERGRVATEALSAAQAGPRLVVEVSDRGPGVAAEEREAIFEPFHRAPQLSAGTSGTGLGLAVCRGIVEAHGGRIQVAEDDAEAPPADRATASEGATFRFWLPLTQPAGMRAGGTMRSDAGDARSGRG